MQGIYRGNTTNTDQFGFSRPINSGIATFDIEYAHWVEEQRRKNSELWKAMHVQAGEIELRMLVDSHLKHYDQLFCMKMDAAKVDVLYIMSGTWRASAERFFLWIGGFRPSKLLNVCNRRPKEVANTKSLPFWSQILSEFSAFSIGSDAADRANVRSTASPRVQPPAIMPAGRGCPFAGNGQAPAESGSRGCG